MSLILFTGSGKRRTRRQSLLFLAKIHRGSKASCMAAKLDASALQRSKPAAGHDPELVLFTAHPHNPTL
jgi:hypothetical protein